MEVRIEHFVNALKMWISTSEQDHNWVQGGGADWTSQAWRLTNFRPPVTEIAARLWLWVYPYALATKCSRTVENSVKSLTNSP